MMQLMYESRYSTYKKYIDMTYNNILQKRINEVISLEPSISHLVNDLNNIFNDLF